VLLNGATSFKLSFDGSKLLYSGTGSDDGDEDGPGARARTFGIIDAKPSGSPIRSAMAH